jgi:dolichol kinase
MALSNSEEEELITRSVLTRKRQQSKVPPVRCSSSETSITSVTGTPSSGLPGLPADGIDQPTLNLCIESALICVPVAVALQRYWSDKVSTWLFLSAVDFAVHYRDRAFPQDLYLWAFPVLIALTVNPDMLTVNMILSLTDPPRDELMSNITVLILALLDIGGSPNLPLVVPLHGYVATAIGHFCNSSLTQAETSLFASLVTNLALSSSTYAKAVLFSPFVALIPFFSSINRVVVLSRVMGPHRRPANTEWSKRRHARVVYFLFPPVALAVFSGYLYSEGISLYSFLCYIFEMRHLYMLGYWTVVLAVVLPVVIKHSSEWQLDLRRKAWHGCVVFMFLLVGPNIDAQFTCVSVAICLVLFLCLEVVRATTLPPFGRELHTILMNYTDHRDTCGPVIVSHIFLLLGIGLPIMLDGSPVGIVCLGLGDAAASIVGRRFGRCRIFGTKTLEGTLAFVVGVSVGLYLCELVGYKLGLQWKGILWVAASTALLEAASGMNDNVIVPLHMLVVCKLLL